MSKWFCAATLAALTSAGCGGENGPPGREGSAGTWAGKGTSAGTSAGTSEGTSAGHLRAITNDGVDLGLVYALTEFNVLLKQQPSDSAEAVLVWREIASGAPLPCWFYYGSNDCTPTRGFPLVATIPDGSACIDPDGRAFVVPPGADQSTVVVNSQRGAASWDEQSNSWVWDCTALVTQNLTVFTTEDRGVLPPVPSRIYVVPAD